MSANNDDEIIQQNLIMRGHSIRNFEPHEIRQLAHNEGKQSAREVLRFIESGRFEPMLDATHKMFRALDPDERRAFAERNPGIMEWVNVWAFTEDLIEFDKFVDIGSQSSLDQV